MTPQPAPPLEPAFGVRPNLLRWLPAQPELAFTATAPAAARAWQKKARQRLLACLGEAPPRVPLRVRLLDEKRCAGYTRTMLTLDTAPHLRALAWLCVPAEVGDVRRQGATPVPAMLATPGHGIGARDLLAMDEKGHPRQEGEGYQKDYALQAVRLGYPVLVIEPLGFGARRDASHRAANAPETGCHAAATIATMLGTTLARLRLNDLQRGLDYLETLPGIDARRVGLMGISGGGQMTLWATAAEPRLKLAVVSGYLNTFRASVMGMHHCICNFVPGLARWFDLPDLAALVAPRPLLAEGGTKDPIFPIAATRQALRRVRGIYQVFDAADCVASDLFVGDHQWSGRKLGRFLAKWL